jgi:hypothetical protein
VLLFVAGFLLVLQTALVLLPSLSTLPVANDRLSPGLIAQAGLALIAALVTGWALLAWVDRRPLSELGFGLSRRVPLELAVGLGIGVAAILGTTALLAALGGYRLVPEPGSVAGWLAVAGTSLVAFAVPAAAEEAVFRGYLFRTLLDGAGPWVAVALTSLLFAWAHGGNPNAGALGLLNIYLAGVLLAVAVLRTASLWFASTLHLGWNWVMAGPLDLPVSGLESYDIPLYDVEIRGADWLTGGAFGPEGGLAGTIAVMVGIGLVLWTTRPGSRLAGTQADRRAGHGNR